MKSLKYSFSFLLTLIFIATNLACTFVESDKIWKWITIKSFTAVSSQPTTWRYLFLESGGPQRGPTRLTSYKQNLFMFTPGVSDNPNIPNVLFPGVDIWNVSSVQNHVSISHKFVKVMKDQSGKLMHVFELSSLHQFITKGSKSFQYVVAFIVRYLAQSSNPVQ